MESSPYVYDYYYDHHYLFPGEYYDPVQPDTEIKENIEDQIWWSPFVDISDVNVQVEGGVATLTGEVESWVEYNSAEKNAFEGGAVSVNNDLVVRFAGEMENNQEI